MEVSSADRYEGAFQVATKAHSAALAVTLDSLPTLTPKGSRTLRQKIGCRRYTREKPMPTTVV
jgi:hypothetical protein